jgi:hypothetical protein
MRRHGRHVVARSVPTLEQSHILRLFERIQHGPVQRAEERDFLCGNLGPRRQDFAGRRMLGGIEFEAQ